MCIRDSLERKLNAERSRSHDRMESVDTLHGSLALAGCSNFNLSLLEHENKGLKQRCNQLEAQIAEREAEMAKLRVRDFTRYVIPILENLQS